MDYIIKFYEIFYNCLNYMHTPRHLGIENTFLLDGRRDCYVARNSMFDGGRGTGCRSLRAPALDLLHWRLRHLLSDCQMARSSIMKAKTGKTGLYCHGT